MNKRVLAFVDGSIYSASVCGHAAWAAGRIGATVDVVHVLGRREAMPTALGARSAVQAELASLDAQRARLMEVRGTAILEDAQALLQQGGAQTVKTDLVHGDLLATLAAREGSAEIVVIGKRGAAADFAISHLGSNLERIARAARRPVLVAARAFRPIRKVLVAHDGTDGALRAIDQIARAPLFSGLLMTVVHVGQNTLAIARRLEDARALLQAGGIAADLRILPGHPDSALARLTEDEGFDLLVMGAYGHSRIRSLLIGSTSAAMIHACKVPVLLLH